ncbi:MAG TPA: SPASM domain-containing protein [Candidatus Omnitrophota bacterium]|nr:SPASM domain-containing protein [Candidatus Omnitrophota bacterium]HSA31283.1 SPASM domain-containing protein [Candidatus Omnitrophota bacterium]
MGRLIGQGFLKFSHFKKFIDKNPSIRGIELSNWGELFLNNELLDIIRYAHQKNVQLTAYNGANLNTVSPKILEALVKYKFHSITCSIDGTTQETYQIYRRRGDLNRVISNIKRINEHKKFYRSEFPRLTWQLIAFGHNEHQIEDAERMAADLGMTFQVKLASDDQFSPIKNKELIRIKSGLGACSREEYAQTYKASYLSDRVCSQLWNHPQINYDGKMLGCCNNYWGDYGNVFEEGVATCLNNERIDYAREMLTGKKDPRADIPCAQCFVYHDRLRENAWLDPEQISPEPWAKAGEQERISQPKDKLA